MAILGLIVLWAHGCGPAGDASDEAAAVPVRLAAVTIEKTAPPVYTSGRLSSVLEARLSFKVGGIISSIGYGEGEAVKKGEALAELVPDEIQAQAQQARSGYEKARRDYGRAQNLYADSVITLERLQDAETGLDLAASALEIAEFNLHHSTIRAPADGRVLRRFAEVNELVAPGQAVLMFGAAGEEWILRASVNDREIIRLRLGDPAVATFDAYPGIRFEAELSEIAEAADPMTGGYEVELRVEPGQHRLVSGFVADIEISTSGGAPHYVIPIDALVEADGNEGRVYTVDRAAGRARAVDVVIGHLAEGRVAVAAGLDDVTEVVTDGAAYLADSSLVRIIE